MRIVLDTGPLVAFLNRRDKHHAWAVAQWDRVDAPLLTCEAVLSEASFLLERAGGAGARVLDVVERGAVSVAFRLADEVASVRRLMNRYASVPMSLAEACLVRMAELYADSTVMTVDEDFAFYRKLGRIIIPTMMPATDR